MKNIVILIAIMAIISFSFKDIDSGISIIKSHQNQYEAYYENLKINKKNIKNKK